MCFSKLPPKLLISATCPLNLLNFCNAAHFANICENTDRKHMYLSHEDRKTIFNQKSPNLNSKFLHKNPPPSSSLGCSSSLSSKFMKRGGCQHARTNPIQWLLCFFSLGALVVFLHLHLILKTQKWVQWDRVLGLQLCAEQYMILLVIFKYSWVRQCFTISFEGLVSSPHIWAYF